MNHDKEKATWLSEFYKQVAEGGQIQYLFIDKWKDTKASPCLDNSPKCWRIKPDPKKIWVVETMMGRYFYLSEVTLHKAWSDLNLKAHQATIHVYVEQPED